MQRSEIRGYIGKNGLGELCFFSSSWADGVPLPHRRGDEDAAVNKLLVAIEQAPRRAPEIDQLEALDAPQRCRVCGCLETIACTRGENGAEACSWAAYDLCTACDEERDTSGFEHPPRSATDPEYERLGGLAVVARG